MNVTEYANHDALGLAALLIRGEVGPRELAKLALDAIEQVNPHLNCVVETLPERAAAFDAKLDGPLAGVPFLGKDLPFEKGVKSEMGSPLAKDYVCPFDTELAIRLRAAGAVNLGRTTTSEFALAAATENRATGKTRNPWDVDRSVAGSSGGAAAAVASGAVPFAQGSDAGGSIRMPSSFCGLVGLKPTRARVTLAPMSSFSYAGLNNVFVLTRTVRDCAAILDLVEGPATGDSIQIARPEVPYLTAIETPPEPLRIASTVAAWSGLPVDGAVEAAVRQAATACTDLGHRIEEATPAFDYARYLKAQKVLWCAFTAHDVDATARELERTPGPDNLQTTTWDLVRRGRDLAAGDVLAALDTYNEIARQASAFWDRFDILMTPTCTIVPRTLGTYDPDCAGGDVDEMFDQLAPHESFTSLFNATGQPAISLPLGMSDDGLPIGVQFAGRFGDEASVLRLAAQMETVMPWHRRRPKFHVANLSA